MESRNGYFQLVVKADGTYLRLYPAVHEGHLVSYDDVNNYLVDKKLYDYDTKALGIAISNLKDHQVDIKLFSTQILAENEYVKIELTPDKMQAVGRFYPPSLDGQLMNDIEIMNSLMKAGVKYGIDKDSINSFLLSRRYCEDIILAKGLKPEEGRDAVITYHFNTDNTLKPKSNEDGSVDFHQLDMISPTKKGDVLATLVPSVLGKTGKDVCGVAIQPKKVATRILRHGKDIHLSEDGLTMYSDVDGHVVLTDNRVFVSNTYEVFGDVDASTGDIVYEGNVLVKGNVNSGYSIDAKGDIIVNGVVEGAILNAGGQIILKRGMQGMSKGKMVARGNIITKFIENSEVKAGGYITTEAIMHSRVSAQGEITVGGKKGFITGGEIRSTSSITVKTAGSTMGTSTLLEVGTDPVFMDDYRELEKKILDMRNDRDKILPILDTYKKKLVSGEKLAQDKLEFVRTLTQNCITINDQLQSAMEKYDKLKFLMNSNENGSVRVQNIAYPGVKITISNVNYFVRNEIHYTRFVRDKADIKLIGL